MDQPGLGMGGTGGGDLLSSERDEESEEDTTDGPLEKRGGK